ncbi:MAG: DUF2283 domain-containing protein [Leptolyngbyaceae bacterium]|nr:DUF2283 domain-containing protein [Leptolyngbyaceae bacterium]
MKVEYDPEVDVLRILLSDEAIADSAEEKNGIIFDYSESGNIVGLEILNASKHTANPQSLEHIVLTQ